MTQYEAVEPGKVIIEPKIRSNFDLKRPKSGDKFYAKSHVMWIIGKNADKIGVLPPNSVDNCVDNVDFCNAHTLYMQRPHTFHRSNCYKNLSSESRSERVRRALDHGDEASRTDRMLFLWQIRSGPVGQARKEYNKYFKSVDMIGK